MDLNKIKSTMLEVIQTNQSKQTNGILTETYQRLTGKPSPYSFDGGYNNQAFNTQPKEKELTEEALLTTYYDLFRTGELAWGMNYSNPDPPWFHLTDKGRQALENISRDPSNPDGYMAYLKKQVSINPVSESYIKEAVTTYNNLCFKSSAVMIGVAVESIILELRDALVNKMKFLQKNPSKDLTSWQTKKVLDALDLELQQKLEPQLKEAFGGYWSAFSTQIRMTRNDVGHPKNIDPIAEFEVHASLLMFPILAKLAFDLKEWINNSYNG